MRPFAESISTAAYDNGEWGPRRTEVYWEQCMREWAKLLARKGPRQMDSRFYLEAPGTPWGKLGLADGSTIVPSLLPWGEHFDYQSVPKPPMLRAGED